MVVCTLSDVVRGINECIFRIYDIDPEQRSGDKGGWWPVHAELLVRGSDGELVPLDYDAGDWAYFSGEEFRTGFIGYTLQWRMHNNRLEMSLQADSGRFHAVFEKVSNKPPHEWVSRWGRKSRD